MHPTWLGLTANREAIESRRASIDDVEGWQSG